MGMSDYVLEKQAEEHAEIDRMARLEERERCAKIAEWFSNVEKFTAADVAARIRSQHN